MVCDITVTWESITMSLGHLMTNDDIFLACQYLFPLSLQILASDWSRQITWPEPWPLIGHKPNNPFLAITRHLSEHNSICWENFPTENIFKLFLHNPICVPVSWLEVWTMQYSYFVNFRTLIGKSIIHFICCLQTVIAYQRWRMKWNRFALPIKVCF